MPISNAKLLIVEDDPAVRTSLERRFRFEGFHVTSAERGEQALDILADTEPDLILLDVMLPGLDGFAVAERIRNVSNVPILMLTARDSVEDRVAGLERGADDYLVKPYAFAELLARLEVLVHRRAGTPRETTLRVADLELDLLQRTVKRDGQTIELKPREFQILEYLIRHKGQVVTRTMLLESVWDYHFDPQTNVIDVHMSRLRQKIDRGFETPLLRTVRGAGYALRDTD